MATHDPFLDNEEEMVAVRVDAVPWPDQGQDRPDWPEQGQYIAKEDETPRKICRKFGVDPERFLKINQKNFPKLLIGSKFKANTRVQLPKRVRRWILEKKIGQDDVRSRQEYPQLNNTYEQGELICALPSCVGRDVEPDPLNHKHWLKEFSFAIFYGLDPTDSTRAEVKYENDQYELDHDQDELVKIVPLRVIIKRKAMALKETISGGSHSPSMMSDVGESARNGQVPASNDPTAGDKEVAPAAMNGPTEREIEIAFILFSFEKSIITCDVCDPLEPAEQSGVRAPPVLVQSEEYIARKRECTAGGNVQLVVFARNCRSQALTCRPALEILASRLRIFADDDEMSNVRFEVAECKAEVHTCADELPPIRQAQRPAACLCGAIRCTFLLPRVGEFMISVKVKGHDEHLKLLEGQTGAAWPIQVQNPPSLRKTRLKFRTESSVVLGQPFSVRLEVDAILGPYGVPVDCAGVGVRRAVLKDLVKGVGIYYRMCCRNGYGGLTVVKTELQPQILLSDDEDKFAACEVKICRMCEDVRFFVRGREPHSQAYSKHNVKIHEGEASPPCLLGSQNGVLTAYKGSTVELKIQVKNQYGCQISWKGRDAVCLKDQKGKIMEVTATCEWNKNGPVYIVKSVSVLESSGCFSLDPPSLRFSPDPVLLVFSSEDPTEWTVEDVDVFLRDPVHSVARLLPKEWSLGLNGQAFRQMKKNPHELTDKFFPIFSVLTAEDRGNFIKENRHGKVLDYFVNLCQTADFDRRRNEFPNQKNIPECEFTIEAEPFARGSFGAVYSAMWHKAPGGECRVAIKFPFALLGKDSNDQVSKMQKEIEPLRQARPCKHVVDVFGVSNGLDLVGRGRFGIVMELCDNTLAEEIQRLSTSEPKWLETVDIVRQAANGIAYLHSMCPHIVHGDVKSENFLVRRLADNTLIIKVADFGLSHAVRTAGVDSQSTFTGKHLGTVTFCAPEAFNENERVREPRDIWGLGCVMYHLMERKLPWEGLKMHQVQSRVCVEKKCPELTKAEDSPRLLRLAMDLCLRHDPKERTSAASLVSNLDMLYEDMAVHALPLHWMQIGMTMGEPPKMFSVPIRKQVCDEDRLFEGRMHTILTDTEELVEITGGNIYNRVCERMKDVMESVEIISVKMVCNVTLYAKYRLGRKGICMKIEGDPKSEEAEIRVSNEAWLWHGCLAKNTKGLTQKGFKTQQSNLHWSLFGSGVYFASDARKSHTYAPPDETKVRNMILARVARGRVAEKHTLADPQVHKQPELGVLGKDMQRNSQQHRVHVGVFMRLLTDTNHRNAPDGMHSVVGVVRPELGLRVGHDRILVQSNVEVISYENDLSYPAFLVQYKWDQPMGNISFKTVDQVKKEF